MLPRALKTIREIHQMQQSDLAERLGISKSHLSEVESGKKKNVSVELLKKYSEVFDIPASTFLSFAEALEGESEHRKSRAAKLLKVLEWTLENNDDGTRN